MSEGYHPLTWLLWLAAAVLAVLLTRNPLYLTLMALAAGMTFAVLARRQPGAALWRPVVGLALLMWLVTLLFNAFTAHLGSIVLFSLPRNWPLLGGPITLESVLYGFISGLTFMSLILAFAAFNSAVGPQTLLRLTPGFALHAGVALTIALSFVPQTLQAWQEIREAQRLRGYAVRRLRDVQPLFVSLLGTGLDRAIQLAESMDARGFGGHMAPLSGRERALLGAGSVAGLTLLLCGLLLRSFTAVAWPAWTLMAAGALLLAAALHRQGRRLHRSSYRRWLWRRRDTAVSLAALVLIAATLGLKIVAPDLLFYYPYPPYALLPGFQPLLGLLYALSLAPALLLPAPSSPLPNPASP